MGSGVAMPISKKWEIFKKIMRGNVVKFLSKISTQLLKIKELYG